MSMIEDAAAEIRELKTGRKIRRNRRRAQNADPGEAANKVFSLDFDFLKQQGFYVPTEKQQRLALELRAVKRRLLRRLGFRRTLTGRRQRRDQNGRKNVVLVTSTRPAEGKTFTSINLALSFALEDNLNVLLIDADVPRPKVLGHLGLESTKGLTDKILDPSLHLSNLILRDVNAPLRVLSEGTKMGGSAEFFASAEMEDLINELSMRFPDTLIIIDAPPVLATSDAVALAKHVHEVIFVVEANATTEPAVASALEELIENNTNISVVLNRCLVSDRTAQYGSYEEYYYRAGQGMPRDRKEEN